MGGWTLPLPHYHVVLCRALNTTGGSNDRWVLSLDGITGCAETLYPHSVMTTIRSYVHTQITLWKAWILHKVIVWHAKNLLSWLFVICYCLDLICRSMSSRVWTLSCAVIDIEFRNSTSNLCRTCWMHMWLLGSLFTRELHCTCITMLVHSGCEWRSKFLYMYIHVCV